jgi:hypothetical protein
MLTREPIPMRRLAGYAIFTAATVEGLLIWVGSPPIALIWGPIMGGGCVLWMAFLDKAARGQKRQIAKYASMLVATGALANILLYLWDVFQSK